MKKIGEGASCSSNSEVIGEFVFIQSVADVINLFDDANGKICIVEDSGTTTLGPILSDLAGVLCPLGSVGSHLAIVSREFEIPCIMSVEFLIDDFASLTGKKGKIVTESEDKGIIYLLE